jgi:coenzyme F420-0:L-glutamate ligase / coenzyme F420-1:gamma-L-glutamate ligase
MPEPLSITPLEGLPLVSPGDDIARLLVAALRRSRIVPVRRDIIVVTQKIVSKAEGRFVDLTSIVPSARAAAIGEQVGKDPRLVEVILSESTDVLRCSKGVLIAAHRLGLVMANAGVDQSNVAAGSADRVLLLPRDPDSSAAMLKERLDREFGGDLGVVITDSFGRPWRNGVVAAAIGAAGLPSLVDLTGAPDLFGRRMQRTQVAVADAIAAAAALVMGECDEGIPAAHMRGVPVNGAPLPASALIRSAETDLFR